MCKLPFIFMALDPLPLVGKLTHNYGMLWLCQDLETVLLP